MSETHDIIAATQMFNANLHELAAQKQSKLADMVRMESMNSQSQFFDRTDNIEMQLRTSRHQDTAYTPIEYSRRRVDCMDYEASDIIDEEDTLRAVINPTSNTTKKFFEATNRNKDRTIINGLLGNAIAADSDFATTNIALPSSQKIAHGSANMSVAKIKNAVQIMGLADVDLSEDKPCLAITWSQYHSLLQESEFINRDYKLSSNMEVNIRAVNEFLGVDIRIVSSDLIPVASNIRRCPLFTKQSLILGMLGDVKAKVLEDPTKGGSLRVITKQQLGAVRLEEARVVEISCQES